MVMHLYAWKSKFKEFKSPGLDVVQHKKVRQLEMQIMGALPAL